jgi:homoserine O-acetyltransferase
MVALAFAELFPERVGRLVVISAGAEPHPVASANRELQRRVVAMGIAGGCADEALAIARGMAMLTYRTPAEFADRFRGGIAGDDPLETSDAGAYLRARGGHFRSVMTPERFLSLSASIDRHRVDPAAIRTPALLLGADTDQLVTPGQMHSLAERLGGKAELHLRDYPYGHDMFLKDAAALSAVVRPYLD